MLTVPASIDTVLQCSPQFHILKVELVGLYVVRRTNEDSRRCYFERL